VNLADYEQPKEWWWVVECSDYLRKLHPGTPRYAVIPPNSLNQYSNVQCRVRYSTETAANAAAIAAESGEEDLVSWAVVWWSASYRDEHPDASRFGAVCSKDIQNVWKLGGKTGASGMARPDAEHEAARRSSLPELWCVVTNEDSRTNRQEPYTVKSFDGLSFTEKDDRVRATCESETAAWQAIPGIVEEDRQREAAYEKQQRERRDAQRRNESTGRMLRFVLMVASIAGVVWLLVTVVHYFWVHPLF
jgi:hypothetical protein